MAAYSHFDGSSKRSKQLLLAAIFGCAIILLGTGGYMLLEGWGFVDAFYMTVITLTTVGFGETHPLSQTGRIYTSLLILVGVGGATYFFGSLMRLIVEGELLRLRGVRKMKKDISRYSNHIVVCGCGRLGRIVTKELVEAKQAVVVIEIDPEALEWLEREQINFVEGKAYEDSTLIDAGIMRARSLLSLLPNDADNVYVTLCARDLNPSLTIVARTEDEAGEKKLLRAGANQVLAPYRVSGTRLVQRIVRPHVSDFLELAAGSNGHQLVIEEVIVSPNSALAGKSLEESDLRNRTGTVIAAFIEPDGKMVFNPGGKSVIQANATMIVMGERESLDRLSELL